MSADDHKQALPPGFTLGSYRIERVLGVGGFGVTYLCEHGGLGVQVAVKEYLPIEVAVRDGAEVHPKSVGDREGFEWGLERFLEEARTLARFRHPNVVRVRDCFEANRTAYIVMDYEDGEPLDALLRRHGTLTEAQLRRIALPLADGLREVHAAGFLHRDVKPANVFVRRSDETPVLLDFGSARQALGHRSRSVTAIASASYSPPEQYESAGERGPWTDVYALSAPVLSGHHRQRASRGADRGLRVVEAERPQTVDEWLVQTAESAVKVAPANKRAAVNGPQHWAKPGRATDMPTSAPDMEPRPDAVEVLRHRPRQGGATAQFDLAEMYVKGDGVPKDVKRATLWFRRAAGQGYAAAQYNLGLIYAGFPPYRGIPRDLVALLCLAKSRDRTRSGTFGESAKRNCAGPYFAENAGESPELSRQLLDGPANAEAQFNLAETFHKGKSVGKNAIEAVFWFHKAAEQGHPVAQNNLAFMYANGEGVAEDGREAVLWFRKAAEQGYAPAQHSLGLMYFKGNGVPKDIGRAYALLTLALGLGSTELERIRRRRYGSGDSSPIPQDWKVDQAKAAQNANRGIHDTHTDS